MAVLRDANVTHFQRLDLPRRKGGGNGIFRLCGTRTYVAYLRYTKTQSPLPDPALLATFLTEAFFTMTGTRKNPLSAVAKPSYPFFFQYSRPVDFHRGGKPGLIAKGGLFRKVAETRLEVFAPVAFSNQASAFPDTLAVDEVCALGFNELHWRHSGGRHDENLLLCASCCVTLPVGDCAGRSTENESAHSPPIDAGIGAWVNCGLRALAKSEATQGSDCLSGR